MNTFFHGLVRATTETFSLAGPILELGSYQVEGQESLINLRSLFPGRNYLGIDFRDGPGVDMVANVEALPHDDASVGTVIAMNIFEHVESFWKGFAEVERVLRPDGALIVACPFYCHIHNFPNDYWRFTPEAFKLLLRNYPNKIVGYHGNRTRPTGVWSIAFREERPPITQQEFLFYQALMKEYCQMPLGWARRLRYQVGRLICGRRPFAPYLDRNRWEMECLTETVPVREFAIPSQARTVNGTRSVPTTV